MSFLLTWHWDAKWERKLYLDFSKVFNNMCILRVLPELPGDVGASQVALVVKNPPANAGDIRDMGSIPQLGRSQEEGMVTHSSILVWRIPWTEETGRLQSMRSHRVAHDWSNLAQ